jgi:hypothetical protein
MAGRAVFPSAVRLSPRRTRRETLRQSHAVRRVGTTRTGGQVKHPRPGSNTGRGQQGTDQPVGEIADEVAVGRRPAVPAGGPPGRAAAPTSYSIPVLHSFG